MSEPRSVKELLELGERVLGDSNAIFEDHDNAFEARQLLAYALGIADAAADELPNNLEPPPRKRERYLACIARRAAGEPLPLIRGHIEFYGLNLTVQPGAFVPRPSSELIVARAARLLRRRRSPVVVDICTGTGPIALAIADEFSNADVWGTDINSGGLVQGRSNAKRLGIQNVSFRRGDMYGALPARLRGTVDMVTAHVPYVPSSELDDLPAEVKDHEPLFTLTDHSDDGLGLMRHAVQGAPEWLEPGGWLLLEMSEDLSAGVTRMCRRAGFEDARVSSDDDDLSVVVEARMRGSRKAAR